MKLAIILAFAVTATAQTLPFLTDKEISPLLMKV